MPELTQIYQKQLDESQLCPLCRASMYWIEGEYYQNPLNFHQCGNCQHCIFYGERTPSCQCAKCLANRKKSLQETKYLEKKTEWRKKNKYKDQTEYLLNDLSLMHKLFLLSVLDHMIDEHRPHDEFIDFNRVSPLHIAPSYQLFRELKQNFIENDYLHVAVGSEQRYLTNIRLHGYREPSLLSLTQQLRQWFYQDLTHGVPYKNADEVHETLLDLLFHEVLAYCQFRCQQVKVQFYSNAHFANSCKLLLKQYAVTQLYYWIDRAIHYLAEQQLLDSTNHNFINTNLLRKTLMQYQYRSQEQHWEVPNLPRPAELAYSQMSIIFIQRFLKLDDKIYLKPFWKSWQDILPRLRFFTECHCIHCGSQDLQVEYSTDDYVSFTCLNCKQQDHYFV